MKALHYLVPLTVLLLLPASGLATTETPRQAPLQVVMRSLDSPRGLAFAPTGALYVAEAGRGGAGPCIPQRGTTLCYGATGAVSRFFRGRQERIATGLPSNVEPPSSATGPHDVAFDGLGRPHVLLGVGTDPARRSEFGPGGASFGWLVRLRQGGEPEMVVDVAAHERTANPSGPPFDSNPFGLLRQGSRWLVAEAGANALLDLAPGGAISTLAVFPSRPARPTDSVPTAVALAPNGSYYVGELTGVPFAPGAARVYRVARGGGEPQVLAEGFTTVIDLAIGRSGRVYVLQHSSGPFFAGSGALIRVNPDGTRSTLASEGLVRPAGLAIGFDGDVYVSNRGVSPGEGEVVRVDAGDERDATFCVVPRVTGRLLAAARAALRRANCTPGTVRRTPAAAAARGRVVRQTPRAGARLAYLGRVNLVVGTRRR